MTTLPDSGVRWITLKDLQNPKMCSECDQALSVKQINLTEACRTCFNEECTAIPLIDYILRSYKDMEFESSETQDLTKSSGGLDEEMQRVNQLLGQVENMVSHRLSEELRNELRICNEKQFEDSNVAKMKLQDCDGPEKFHGDFSSGVLKSQGTFCTNILPRSSFDFCQENGATLSQFEENSAPCYQSDPKETCATINSSDAISANLQGSPLSNSAYDNSPNDMWDCDIDVWQNDCERDYVGLNPDVGDINFEAPTDCFDTPLDTKDNLVLSNGGLVSPVGCSNSELKIEESGEDKPLEGIFKNHLDPSCSKMDKDEKEKSSESILRTLVDPSCFEEGEDKKDLSVEKEISDSDENFNFSMKKTPFLRCYRPSRGRQRTAKPETEAKINVDENFSTNTKFEISSTIPFLVDEPSDIELFPTPSASPDSCQEQLKQDVSSFSPSKGAFFVDVDNLPGKPRPVNIVVHLSDEGQVTLVPGSGKPTLADSALKKDNKKGRLKKNSSKKSKEASVTKVQPSPMPSAGSKLGLGFSELKQFGGAKCSAPENRIKAVKRSGKGKKKTGKNELTTKANDDIEKAIATVQQSNVNESPHWDTLLSDILN